MTFPLACTYIVLTNAKNTCLHAYFRIIHNISD